MKITFEEVIHEVPGTIDRVLYGDVPWDNTHDYRTGNPGRLTTDNLSIAEVASSQIVGSKQHAPVFDLDVLHELVPSSTPGHSHLYIDVPMSWFKYKVLLRVLAWTGIVEPGYVRASIHRGHSDVRLPWVKKPVV